jgi:hypothetical protein
LLRVCLYQWSQPTLVGCSVFRQLPSGQCVVVRQVQLPAESSSSSRKISTACAQTCSPCMSLPSTLAIYCLQYSSGPAPQAALDHARSAGMSGVCWIISSTDAVCHCLLCPAVATPLQSRHLCLPLCQPAICRWQAILPPGLQRSLVRGPRIQSSKFRSTCLSQGGGLQCSFVTWSDLSITTAAACSSRT